jgi:hypothetical protein
VRHFTQAQGVANVRLARKDLGSLEASYFEGTDDDDEPSLWRVWGAGRNGRVVTISYTCGETDREVERASVDAIIASVEWLF